MVGAVGTGVGWVVGDVGADEGILVGTLVL